MQNRLEMRRASFDRSFRWHKRFFWGLVILVVIIVGVKGYVAYKAGCLPSMILYEVCVSDPAIDRALKNVIGK